MTNNKVLIVGNGDSESLKRRLETYGYVSFCAGDTEKAMHEYKQHEPRAVVFDSEFGLRNIETTSSLIRTHEKSCRQKSNMYVFGNRVMQPGKEIEASYYYTEVDGLVNSITGR